MIEDFFLLFFGHNLHFFWLYRQIKSALNFKSYNVITCMESHWSPGSFAIEHFFCNIFCCALGNFVFKFFWAVFKLIIDFTHCHIFPGLFIVSNPGSTLWICDMLIIKIYIQKIKINLILYIKKQLIQSFILNFVLSSCKHIKLSCSDHWCFSQTNS